MNNNDRYVILEDDYLNPLVNQMVEYLDRGYTLLGSILNDSNPNTFGSDSYKYSAVMLKDVDKLPSINVENIKKIDCGEGDTLILSIPYEEMEKANILIENFKRLFPDTNVVVLSDNISINIVSNTAK